MVFHLMSLVMPTIRKRLERFMSKEGALRVDVVPKMLLLGFVLSWASTDLWLRNLLSVHNSPIVYSDHLSGPLCLRDEMIF
jgi:hypothetical protein